MTVLIAYGTIEGQTGKIARFADKVAAEFGAETLLVDASDISARIDWSDIDQVILAASVHQRRHPREFEAFVAAHEKELDLYPTLLMSVSLSAAFEEGMEEAQDYADEMKMRTGLDPDEELLVAGAIKARRYDYFETQVLKHVVLRGKNFDPAVEEHEFTDWDAVQSALEDFIA